MIRILIADDHSIVREGLAAILSRQPDLQVVGEACNGNEAIELFRRQRPDIILMDVRMPELDGIQATRSIVTEAPDACVIGLTATEFVDRPAMVDAGAIACLLKDTPSADLLAFIRSVCGT